MLGFMLLLTLLFWWIPKGKSKELRRTALQPILPFQKRVSYSPAQKNSLDFAPARIKGAEGRVPTLSASLLQVQDQERRRIARELHDSTAQVLCALAVNLDRASSLALNEEALGILQDSRALLEQVTTEIRTMSYLLHPPMLDELGLEYVLPWYTEGFSKRSGISTRLTLQPDLGRLPREVELALFRITQEALANVHRHSGSATAHISLCRNSESVILVVEDQGCGLPQDALQAGARPYAKLGVGIAGMRERAGQLGGSVTISCNSGTTVQAVLPLQEASAAAPEARFAVA
jgi:signal transduction histidine kinase